MMFIKILCALLFVVAVSALDYQDCGSTAIVNGVSLDGCTEQPCVMIKGLDYTFRVHGRSTNPANQLPYTVRVTILGVPITIVEGNACESLEVGMCPHLAGEEFTYARVLNIGAAIPLSNAVITTRIQDESGRVVICASLDVQFINP